MAYATEPLLFNSFKGIREYNGVNSGGAISAIKASNVELVQTDLGQNTGVKSSGGNYVAYKLPSGYEIKGIFASVQDGIDYTFIYAETAEKGTLFYIDLADDVQIVIDDLSATGNCNALTMSSTAFDVFVFTNGKEVKTVCFTEDEAYGDTVQTIDAEDYEGRKINWLSMTEWNGFLVVASQYGVHASHQNDIYNWKDDPQDVADSWYINFSKKVTAVVSFTNGLYIFTEDDVSFLNTTPNDTANSIMKTASMNGCMNYQSVVKHDTFLFFYDNKQKNIYYIQITDTGQTRPTGPVAKEIQSYFQNIKKFKMFSCIYNNRNEIWCIIDEHVLIYDYFRNEWVTRQEQNIETVALINNTVMTGGNLGKVYVENINLDFDGMFYPAIYQTTFINIGSNSNLKKQKTPLLLVVNDNYENDFWVQITANGKEKNPKRVKVLRKNTSYYDEATYDVSKYSVENPYAKKVVEISTPQTWYTLGVKIYTEELGQGFYINSMELKNIKIKTKTRGR